MEVRSDHLLDGVVEWFEERFGHFDDSSGNYIFLVTLQELLLIMGRDLYLFKIRFSGTLPQNALIFTARSCWQIPHGWVVL